MESYKPYNVQGSIRPECLKIAKEWVAPTGDEIKIALAMANCSGVEFARRIGTNDRTVRRWIGDELSIPYAAWCILCLEANLGTIWR